MTSGKPSPGSTPEDEVARAFARMEEDARGLPGLMDVDAAERRRLFDPLALAYARVPVAGVTREETDYGLRHRPDRPEEGPQIAYIHGGGWVFLSPHTHARFCDLLARRTGRVVHSIRYPLAPEHPFPAAPDAVEAALHGLASDGPVLVAGDSAGANLALSAALSLGPDIVCGAGLIYGAFDDDMNTASHARYGGGSHPLTTEEMAFFWRSYAPGDRPWRARPLHGPLDRAPPTVVLIAETDCLRSDSETLIERLAKAGRPVTARVMTGYYHGAILHDAMLPGLRPHLNWFADSLVGLAPP